MKNDLYLSVCLIVTLGSVPATAADDGAIDLAGNEIGSNCVVEPNIVVEISSHIDGILDEVLVERGDWVTAHGIVAKLEAGVELAVVAHSRARAAMESEILSNEVSLGYGERTHERVAELHVKKVVSTDEIDRVASEAKIARYRLQQSKENKRLAELELARTREVLKRHTIRSPIDGVVAERYLNPGESVEEKPILRIAQLDPLRVELVVPASEYGLIHPGEKALVRLDDARGSEHAAHVTIVDPLIDAASGTFRVTLELPNPEHELTSGLRCAVSFLDTDETVATTMNGQNDMPVLLEAPNAGPLEFAVGDPVPN